MKKATINYWIDVGLFVGLVDLVISGFVMKFGTGDFFDLVGVQYTTWLLFHDWGAYFFTVCSVLHIILHWQWIVCMTKRMVKGEEKKC